MLLLVFSCSAHCFRVVLIAAAAPVCNLFRCICLRRKDFGDGLDTAPRKAVPGCAYSSSSTFPLSSPLRSSSLVSSSLLLFSHLLSSSYCGQDSTGKHFFCFADSRVWQCIFLKFPIYSAIYLSLKHCGMTCSPVFWPSLVASLQLECCSL